MAGELESLGGDSSLTSKNQKPSPSRTERYPPINFYPRSKNHKQSKLNIYQGKINTYLNRFYLTLEEQHRK